MMMAMAWSVVVVLAMAGDRRDPRAIDGEGPGDLFGWAVSSAGDVNGDGADDLIIGAPANDAVAGFAGRAYLFHGPFGRDLSVADTDAIISAEAFGDNLGIAVAGAGDVNRDGFDDVVIGARGNDGAGIQAGRVYLFLGPLQGHLDATQADAIISGFMFEELGMSLAGGADVNGDGFDDLVLGAPRAGGIAEVDRGRVYVFFGPVSGSRPSSSANVILEGDSANDQLGTSIAAGDLDHDGFADLLIGAPHFPLEIARPGKAYLFQGPVVGFHHASSADAILAGEEQNDNFGDAVAIAGDTNGDGFDDVIVGANQLFRTGPAGKAYVFRGPLRGNVAAEDAAAIFLGETAEDLFGSAVSSAGDLNGDRLADVIVGAWDNGAGGGRAGRAYAFFGPQLGTISGADADLILTGFRTGDRLGHAVASPGDLNRSGLGDLLLGVPQFFDQDSGFALLYLDPAGHRRTAARRFR